MADGRPRDRPPPPLRAAAARHRARDGQLVHVPGPRVVGGVLFDVMLAPTPPGYGKVTWNQLKRTYEEMFRRISRECRDGLRWGSSRRLCRRRCRPRRCRPRTRAGAEWQGGLGVARRAGDSGCGSGRNKQGGCRCQGGDEDWRRGRGCRRGWQPHEGRQGGRGGHGGPEAILRPGGRARGHASPGVLRPGRLLQKKATSRVPSILYREFHSTRGYCENCWQRWVRWSSTT